MTTRDFALLLGGLLLAPAPRAQESSGLDPKDILKPLGNDWPTYSGDYSGRRDSPVTEGNQANVKNLTLAWVSHLTGGLPSAAPGGFGGGGGGRGRGGGGGGGIPLAGGRRGAGESAQ